MRWYKYKYKSCCVVMCSVMCSVMRSVLRSVMCSVLVLTDLRCRIKLDRV